MKIMLPIMAAAIAASKTAPAAKSLALPINS